jgi:hypothetical protein
VIDTMTVLRLKRGLVETYDPKDWGSRTDYLCARSTRFDHGLFPFWLLSDPKGFSGKPTTGLCAVAEAISRGYTDIYLIGFDRVLHPERPGEWLAHDKWAEHRYLKSLPARITELGDIR